MDNIFEDINITGQVLIVRSDVTTGETFLVEGENIVTNSGDWYYAQLAAQESATCTFSGIRLGDDNTAPTKNDNDVTSFLSGTGKAVDGTYPKTNDDDGDNTGAGIDIVTWRFSYGTGEGNASGIYEGAICDDLSSPNYALTHFLFASEFDKTSNDTLKVFVNHTFNGT
jgi:hypothetical protein